METSSSRDDKTSFTLWSYEDFTHHFRKTPEEAFCLYTPSSTKEEATRHWGIPCTLFHRLQSSRRWTRRFTGLDLAIFQKYSSTQLYFISHFLPTCRLPYLSHSVINSVNCSSKVLTEEIHSTVFSAPLSKFSNFICDNVGAGLVIFSLSNLIFFYQLTGFISLYFLY